MKQSNLARCLDRSPRQFGKVVDLPISYRPSQDVSDSLRAMQKDFPHLSFTSICTNLLADQLIKYGYLNNRI